MPNDQQQAHSKHNDPTESSIWIRSLRSDACDKSFGTQNISYTYMLFSALVVTTLKKYHLQSAVQQWHVALKENILREHYDLHPHQWNHKDERVAI